MNIQKQVQYLSTLTGIEFEESKKYINKIIESYNVATEESLDQILFNINDLANKYAVTEINILEALYQVEGIEIKEAAKYVALIGESIAESGKVVGNAMKDIANRIKSLDEDVVDLFKPYFVGANDTVSEVFMKLADEWKSIDPKTQVDIALKLAGNYHLSKFFTLMNELNKETK